MIGKFSKTYLNQMIAKGKKENVRFLIVRVDKTVYHVVREGTKSIEKYHKKFIDLI